MGLKKAMRELNPGLYWISKGEDGDEIVLKRPEGLDINTFADACTRFALLLTYSENLIKQYIRLDCDWVSKDIDDISDFDEIEDTDDMVGFPEYRPGGGV